MNGHLQTDLSVMECPFSGFELVFIFAAFTVFCVFGLVAIFRQPSRADNQDENIHTVRSSTRHERTLKKKPKATLKANGLNSPPHTLFKEMTALK
ncbi:uncharacterized protein LOC143525130 isoform X2 [Brachyhypopomus gauderio]|uniref:uncharacterized protein LOC143525130 isoform X2 n=1 Tax=Brachyhypopomus gauderio TaxID=698409 RepID=UPI004041C94B